MISSIASSQDSLVRMRLRTWPERPPGYPVEAQSRACWFRARPSPACERNDPYLKLVGSDRLRTYPDGLWLAFGGTPVERYVDIFVVEACGSISNLSDKRSRFAPSTHSMVAVCPPGWLRAHRGLVRPIPRWRRIGLYDEPESKLSVPVRDMRVMYALNPRQYRSFAASQVPNPHELFVPMNQLTAVNAAESPAMRHLVAKAATTANFWAPVGPLPAARSAA